MLEEINRLPRKLIKDLDFNMEQLSIYLVQDFNLKLLNRIVKFSLDIFGDLGMDEMGLVPQIRHGNVFLLMEKGKPQVIGLAMFMRDWDTDDKVYLFDYAIKEGFQGHGLGFEFLKGIAENLVEQGFNIMSLTVDVENDSALRLYKEKFGFETLEFKKNEYGEGQDRYYMELDMNDFLEQAKK